MLRRRTITGVRATAAMVFVEVFGFWRRGDIDTHYKNLSKGVPGKFVLCVSEQMRADEESEVTFGSGVYRYKRTPLPEQVARIAELVAGIDNSAPASHAESLFTKEVKEKLRAKRKPRKPKEPPAGV